MNSALRIAAILSAALWLLPSAARADQFQWLEADQAVTAQARVAEVAIVRHYCKPCGDESSRAESVHEVEIARVEGETKFWNVLINGEAVDLAYVYVPRDGAWRNLALLMELPATDVPERLERALVEGGSEEAYD